MSEESLAERIRQRLSVHDGDKAARRLQVEGDMKLLLGNRERYFAEARRLLHSIIYPRMKELSVHFDNCRLSSIEEDTERCRCEFSHSQRFPATVSFTIGLTPKDEEEIGIYYELQILPIHIEFRSREERSFTTGSRSDNEIAQWVEMKILYFLDAYLQLENNPAYQKDNMVQDPVCGMKISANEAIGKIQSGTRTFFFCSEACKQAFLSNPK